MRWLENRDTDSQFRTVILEDCRRKFSKWIKLRDPPDGFTHVEHWQKNYVSINERYTENFEKQKKKQKTPAYQ